MENVVAWNSGRMLHPTNDHRHMGLLATLRNYVPRLSKHLQLIVFQSLLFLRQASLKTSYRRRARLHIVYLRTDSDAITYHTGQRNISSTRMWQAGPIELNLLQAKQKQKSFVSKWAKHRNRKRYSSWKTFLSGSSHDRSTRDV